MRAAVLAVWSLLVVSLAPPAGAQQQNAAVADWVNFCFETRGDQSAAFARADVAGYSTQTDQRGRVSRVLEGQSGRHILGFFGPGANGTVMCIASHPTIEGGPAASLEALFGHPPTYNEGVSPVWVFDNTGGDLVYLSNDDTDRARLSFSSGRAVLVRSIVREGLDMVMYEFRPAPVQ